jgi:small subunit ribosomal protein S17
MSDEAMSEQQEAGEAMSEPSPVKAVEAVETQVVETVVVTAEAVLERNARKVREGIVVSDKMEQTAVVAVVERVRHSKYSKTVQRTKKLYVHDVSNDAHVGDRVRVAETRPLSKLKRWRLVEVLERAK